VAERAADCALGERGLALQRTKRPGGVAHEDIDDVMAQQADPSGTRRFRDIDVADSSMTGCRCQAAGQDPEQRTRDLWLLVEQPVEVVPGNRDASQGGGRGDPSGMDGSFVE
jgi:hypothetical protein